MNTPLQSSRARAMLVLDCLLIFLLAGYMIRPLFKANYLDQWASIESTFIADGRFLKDHWPHPRWQPLWYAGTRFDYIYPPALRYGTALLAKIYIPAKAYHLYTAFFYCLGITGIYLFMRLLGNARAPAWLGAVATGLLSPGFLFVRALRADSFHLAPQRLTALARYGEGPHMTALALLPFALACAFYGLRPKRQAALAGAAAFSALVVSNNFYGATALAILFPVLVWSLWITHRDRRIWIRAAAITALAYGLTAFWLTPSYFRITVRNLRYVSERGNVWSYLAAVVAVAAFVVLSDRFARARPERAYLVFVSGALWFMGLNVLGYYWFGFRVVGEPGRLVPELDLVMILASIEGLRRLWNVSASPRLRVPVSLLVLVCLSPAREYISHRWTLFLSEKDYRQRVEYQITDWMARNLPDARALASGSVRFWYNAWYDLPQVGGGSEQGLLNPAVIPPQWEILLGEKADLAIQWLICLGTDAVIVPDQSSREIYHDFRFPRKFAGVLPVLYDDHEGNVIYRVPRRFPGLARVVSLQTLRNVRPIQSQVDLEGLRAYAAMVEHGPDSPAPMRWEGTDAMRVQARVGPGEALLVQESFDPAWRAWSGGKPVPIREDLLGFMLLEPPPGEHDIRLVFELPLENLVGRILTAISLLLVVGLLIRR